MSENNSGGNAGVGLGSFTGSATPDYKTLTVRYGNKSCTVDITPEDTAETVMVKLEKSK